MKIHPKINIYESINFEPLKSEFIQDVIENSKAFVLKKNDFSTTVGILQGKAINKNYDLLIKRFNYRGVFDFLIHKLFNKDRAERLWKKNLMLYNKGIPVPIPLQYIKATFKEKNAFFISTVLSDTENLSEIYRKNLLDKEENLNKQLAISIANFHNLGAIHGDLKWPNILVQADNSYKIFFIDLDQSSCSSNFNLKGIYKDLIRFYRFGLQLGAEKWVKKNFFPVYLYYIDNEIRKKINVDRIINKAEIEWIKKGRERFL